MSQNKVLISLASIVAIIIIGMSTFVFTHLSGIDLSQGIVLIILSIIGLLLILGIIYIAIRSVRNNK
jgi:uncharacterized membrane protein